MRTWRRSVGFVSLALLGLTVASGARAQLLIAATPGEPPAIAHAELAYASGSGTPVTWLSLRVQRGPVALVAALSSDAVAEVGLDAWFASLEITASPNITLPKSASNCGDTSSYVHVAWPRSVGVAPTELSVQTPDDVAAALAEQGLKLDGALPPAERYVIWSWSAADGAQTTRTLRITGGSSPLSLLPGAAFPVLVSSVTRGATALPTELLNRELSVTFVAAQPPASDYVERLQDWLVSRSEPLLELRARGPLFDWFIYEDTLSLGSLVSTYALRAAKELPGLDARTCSEQLRALRDPGAPSAAACGEANDASLALSAAGPDSQTLQRVVVSGASGLTLAEAAEGGTPSAPLLRAERVDDSACQVLDQPLPQPVQSPVYGGGSPAPTETTTVVVEETVVVDDRYPSEVSCGGSPQPERDDTYYAGRGDSCASDTSSSSESDSSDSCSGDSSNSSSDNGCASDSSSSSSDDSGCASDSSSSSSSDDSGCNSGSDSSYDGDTCTGSAAPGAERSQKTAGLSPRHGVRRPARLKTSLWSMAFAALVLPIRRRKGRQNRRH